jgi:hypothetical protein
MKYGAGGMDLPPAGGRPGPAGPPSKTFKAQGHWFLYHAVGTRPISCRFSYNPFFSGLSKTNFDMLLLLSARLFTILLAITESWFRTSPSDLLSPSF